MDLRGPIDSEWAGAILADHFSSRTPTGDPMLDALQVAILLEDVFGVTVAESDLRSESLGSPEVARETLERIRRGA